METLREEIIQRWSHELVGRNFTIRLLNAGDSKEFTDISAVTVTTVLYIILVAQRGFSNFKEYEAIEMAKLGVLKIGDIDKSKPPAFVDFFVSNDTLQAAETLIVCNELQRRVEYFDLEENSEYTMREFISPILLGALELYGKFNELKKSELKLVCEMKVSGSAGNGPVDYIVTYKKTNIILTEAKKDEIDKGVVQNLCQQVASVQEVARSLKLTTSKKRKFEEILADVEMMPTYGIVSTGDKWIFLRYWAGAALGSPRLRISEEIDYSLKNLKKFTVEANLESTCNLIRMIAGIVKEQVDNMNEWEPKYKKDKEGG